MKKITAYSVHFKIPGYYVLIEELNPISVALRKLAGIKIYTNSEAAYTKARELNNKLKNNS